MNNFQEELNLALKNIQENQKEKAEEILKKILSKDKKNLKSLFFLGNIYSEKKLPTVKKIFESRLNQP